MSMKPCSAALIAVELTYRVWKSSYETSCRDLNAVDLHHRLLGVIALRVLGKLADSVTLVCELRLPLMIAELAIVLSARY